jgi:hypothetical protein
MIGQLGDELDNLRENGLLDGLDIPLVGDAVDQVLNFADTVRRGLLYDPGADGEEDGADRLATDLNAALEAANLGNVIVVQGAGTKLRFVAIDPTVEGFTVAGSGGFSELGFAADAGEFKTIHEATPTKVGSGIISADAVLQFAIKRAGVTPPPTTLTLAATTTRDNVAIDRLATDLNAALMDAGLGNVIVVQGAGTKLRFVGIDPTVEFTVAGSGGGFNQLGFDADAGEFNPIHEATPADGIISADAVLQFTIKRAGVTQPSTTVTLAATATTDNVAVGDDTIKLVRADNSATFDSVQGLIFRLLTLADELDITLPEPVAPAGAMALLSPSSLSSVLKVIDYQPDKPGKPLTVNIGKFVPALDYVKELPLDFNLGLGPVGDITTDGKVKLTAHVGLDENFGLGIYLGSPVPGAPNNLAPDTPLEELNDGDGVRIKTAPALTADNAVPTDVIKAPSTDVTFTITINGTPHTIFVPAASDTGDINVTKALASQSETAIVVNPVDSNIIAVGANDNTSNNTNDFFWITFNAGKDWQKFTVPVPSDTFTSRGDPTLAFNEDGTRLVYAHLVRLLDAPSTNDSTVVAAAVYSVVEDPTTGAKSLNSLGTANIGRSRDVPLDRDGDNIITEAERLDLDGDFVADDDDKEYLAVGKDAKGNDLYVVTWHRDHAIYISTSNDALTWSQPTIIGGVTDTKDNSVTFPPHGSLLSGGAANVPTATGSSIDSIPAIGPTAKSSSSGRTPRPRGSDGSCSMSWCLTRTKRAPSFDCAA